MGIIFGSKQQDAEVQPVKEEVVAENVEEQVAVTETPAVEADGEKTDDVELQSKPKMPRRGRKRK